MFARKNHDAVIQSLYNYTLAFVFKIWYYTLNPQLDKPKLVNCEKNILSSQSERYADKVNIVGVRITTLLVKFMKKILRISKANKIN